MGQIGNPMDAVASLLGERQRYEAWIAALDAKRDQTPPHVYQRVRADYDSRLKAVMEQLSNRTFELEAVAASLAERLSKVQSEEAARRDEMAESELRHTVGELTPEQWQEVSEQHEKDVGRLSEERTSLGGELTRIQQILSMVSRRPSEAMAAVQQPVAEPERPPLKLVQSEPEPASTGGDNRRNEPGLPGAAATAGAGTRRPGGDEMMPDSHAFDELAFLKSVVDTKGEGAQPTPAEPPRRVTAQVRPPNTPPTPPSSPVAPANRAGTPSRPMPAVPSTPGQRQSGGTTAPAASANPGTQQPAAQPPAPRPSEVQPPRKSEVQPPRKEPPTGPKVRPEPPSGPKARPITGSIPTFLKDVPSEPVKTLKCQECGTMNYPTEWYCERCGGELAAM